MYRIIKKENKTFTLSINAENPVFLGHFPGHPIVPGVCILEMIEDLIANCIERKITLKVLKKTKFLTPLSPQTFSEFKVELKFDTLEGNELSVDAIVFFESIIISKMSAIYNIN